MLEFGPFLLRFGPHCLDLGFLAERTDGRTDGQTDSPCVLQDFVPFGAAAQKGTFIVVVLAIFLNFNQNGLLYYFGGKTERKTEITDNNRQ